jgi:excisionase family DNA binding protein
MSIEVRRKYLSEKQTAEYMGVSPSTIRRMVSDGVIPITRIGKRRIVISLERLEKWLDSQTSQAASSPTVVKKVRR